MKDNINYLKYRNDAGLTREEAVDLMTDSGMNTKMLERIEKGREPLPIEVLDMARAYQKPELCNEYCTKVCKIGKEYIPAVDMKDLSRLALTTLNTLNHLDKDKERLVEICEDGNISEDEQEDFDKISDYIEQIAIVSAALKLWKNEYIKNAK